ncbi:hypothetical protein ACQ4LE_007526 [Meloidogyne hapla]
MPIFTQNVGQNLNNSRNYELINSNILKLIEKRKQKNLLKEKSEETEEFKRKINLLNKKENVDENIKKEEGISQNKLICQYFVFGILFGAVCSISACSCIFRSRHSNTTQRAIIFNGTALEEATLNRLTQIREPFSPDKPYCLKIDEKGLYYACPLNNKEIPPLPNYLEACKMPTATNWALNDIKASPI